MMNKMNDENKKMVKQFRIFAGITSADQEVQEKVLISECLELITAYGNDNEPEIIDGIGDVLFCLELCHQLNILLSPRADLVLHLAFMVHSNIELSLYEDFLIVEAVCISNLSKFDKSEFEAIKTKEKYLKAGIATRYELINGLYITRAIGGDHLDYPKDKVLKSLTHYNKPDFDFDFYFKE